jgi:hypothetical protein
MASDTAIPLAKRQLLAASCAEALSRADDPVTKPALPANPSTASPLAVNDAPSCDSAALALDFSSGGTGAGNDFALIGIRDVANASCELTGPITVTGVDQTGRAVTQTLTYSVQASLVLTASAPPGLPGLPTPPGVVTAVVTLGAGYRDDPSAADGVCSSNRVVPTDWHLAFPDSGSRTVLNFDRHPSYPQFAHLITCKGQLDKAGPIGPSQ